MVIFVGILFLLLNVCIERIGLGNLQLCVVCVCRVTTYFIKEKKRKKRKPYLNRHIYFLKYDIEVHHWIKRE